MSFQLHSATVTTFAPSLYKNCLVESGLVDLGPISGDLSLREPMDCIPQRQMDFLKLADKNTKRLWFLWKKGDNCGCWGACLFLGDSIKRPLTRYKNECPVYNAQRTEKGLESLENNLSSHTIRDIDCLHTIHKALLEHYKHKYTLPTQGLVPGSRPYSYVSDGDDDSFVSARTSLTSLLLEEETDFMSLDNLNSVSSKLKSRPPPLTLLNEPIEEGSSNLETYKDISHTHLLNEVQVRVRMGTEVEEEDDKNRHVPVQRSRSDGAALLPSKSTLKKVPSQQHLLLRLPQLSLYNNGQVPFIAPRSTLMMKTKDRLRSTRGSEESNDGGATFSLSLTVGGSARAVLTPMASDMIKRSEYI